MLLKFFKIFLGIILSFLVVFLLYFTFFINEDFSSSLSGGFFDKMDKKTYELFDSTSGNIEKITPENNIGTFYKKLNNLDSIYFRNRESFSMQEKDGFSVLSLEKSIFLVDLNDITKRYKIKSNGFEIDVSGAGKIYIDLSSEKNIIFSLDSTFKLIFKDINTSDDISSIYLFPHNYIKFSPEKNAELDNSDIFRIKTKVSNGYFKYKLTNKSKLIKILKEEGLDFFQKSFSFINKFGPNFNEKYNKLNLFEVSSYPGQEYVEKYFSYLINDSKKVVYYKNKILNNLILFFHLDSPNQEIQEEIVTDLYNLKGISLKDYNDMLDIINGFYSTITKKDSLKDRVKLYNFADLILKINNSSEGISSLRKDLSYLKSIYSYHSSRENSYINTYFRDFVKDFYDDLEISNNKVIFTHKIDKVLMESFLFYMEDFIKSNLFTKSNKNLGNINYILKKYLNLSNTIYFSNPSNEIIKTGLIKNKDMLVLISRFIFDNLLNKPGIESSILTMKQGSDIFKNKDIEDLKANVYLINKLHLENMTALSDKKDKILSSFYINSEENFRKYFLALLDYSKYSGMYDSSQKGLIDHINTSKDKEDLVYSKVDVINYLSNFNYVSLQNTTVSKIGKENKFKVENFLVRGNNMSFIIDFDNYKNIDEIFINDEKQFSSYPLDDLEVYWKEIYDSNSSEDREQYNFKNFFDRVFFEKKDVSAGEVIDVAPKEIVETKVISAFKKNILSDSGELGKLKGVLDIKYNDLVVNSLTDINIKDSKLYTFDNSESSSKRYVSNLSSQYYLEEDAKSYFGGDSGIDLEVYDNLGSGNRALFGGNKLKLIGDIIVSEFKDNLTNITLNFSKIDTLYKTIANKFNSSSIDIRYFIDNGDIIFKLENNGKIISITLLSNKVTSIKSGITEYIVTPIDYNLIGDTLKEIN